ncbi:MAG: hypothetical protein K2X98_05965, partial [Alphaproteobacteria bacterium]|nr:hypothetical protein [Alphaproteobacteria bacterium]
KMTEDLYSGLWFLVCATQRHLYKKSGLQAYDEKFVKLFSDVDQLFKLDQKELTSLNTPSILPTSDTSLPKDMRDVKKSRTSIEHEQMEELVKYIEKKTAQTNKDRTSGVKTDDLTQSVLFSTSAKQKEISQKSKNLLKDQSLNVVYAFMAQNALVDIVKKHTDDLLAISNSISELVKLGKNIADQQSTAENTVEEDNDFKKDLSENKRKLLETIAARRAKQLEMRQTILTFSEILRAPSGTVADIDTDTFALFPVELSKEKTWRDKSWMPSLTTHGVFNTLGYKLGYEHPRSWEAKQHINPLISTDNATRAYNTFVANVVGQDEALGKIIFGDAFQVPEVILTKSQLFSPEQKIVDSIDTKKQVDANEISDDDEDLHDVDQKTIVHEAVNQVPVQGVDLKATDNVVVPEKIVSEPVVATQTNLVQEVDKKEEFPQLRRSARKRAADIPNIFPKKASLSEVTPLYVGQLSLLVIERKIKSLTEALETMATGHTTDDITNTADVEAFKVEGQRVLGLLQEAQLKKGSQKKQF